jgi:hypothetical protein
VISTPLSLMFGPTVSLLSPSCAAATDVLLAAVAAEDPDAKLVAAELLAPVAAAPFGLFRWLYASGSRLLKKGDCSAMMYFL